MRKVALSVLVLSVLPAFSVFSGARHFTFLYEAPTSAPGSVELENWATFLTGNENDKRFSELDFRHEFELGITSQLQIGLYLADWKYQTGFADQASGFAYSASAIEAIYNLTNPVIDPVGISVYQEVRVGDRLVESESKLIAQKNFGPLILDYNLTLEADWTGQGLSQRQGELQQAVGASYELSPRVSVGLEFVHEFVFPDWRDEEKIRNIFIGPNVAYRRRNWFVTVTALAQATNTSGEPDVQVRTIFGIGF